MLSAAVSTAFCRPSILLWCAQIQMCFGSQLGVLVHASVDVGCLSVPAKLSCNGMHMLKGSSGQLFDKFHALNCLHFSKQLV